MTLPSTFYVVLIVVNTVVVYTETTPVFQSFSSVIIQFNNTLCKIQDGVLSIDGKVIGNLTEEQKEELERYTNRTEEWSNQLHHRIQQIIEKMLESMKNIWKTTWNFPSEFLAQKSTRNDIATTEGKSEDQEGSDDSSLFSALEPPSFCKIK